MQTTHSKLLESQALVQTEMTRYDDMVEEKEKEIETVKANITQKVKETEIYDLRV